MKHIGVRKYKERKILRRMFLGIFSTSALCILIACGIGFFWMQSVYLSRMRENVKKELSSYQLTVSNALSIANQTMELLGKNTTISRVIVGNSSEWDSNVSAAADQLLNMVSANRDLHSIYVMGSSDSLIKVLNSQYPVNYMQNQAIEAFFYQPQQGRYRLFSYEDSYGRQQRLLSIATGELSGETLSNGIMVNVDIGELVNRIFPGTEEGEAYLLLDNDCRVLGYKGGDYPFGQDVSGDLFVQNAKGSGWNLDGAVLRENSGRRYLLSAVEDRENSCRILHIAPYSKYFASVQRVLYGIIGAGILFSFLAAGAAVWISNRLYHPIDQVVNLFSANQSDGKSIGSADRNRVKHKEKGSREKADVTELSGLSKTMNTMIAQLNQFQMKSETEQLRAYLMKQRKGNQLPELLSEFAEDNGNFPYQAVVLRICDITDFIENNTSEAAVLKRQTMRAMLEQEMQDLGEALFLQIDEEYTAMLLFYFGSGKGNELEVRIRRFFVSVKELMSVQQNAGISEMRFDIEELHQAYQSARAATGYRFLYGMNELITERQMQACALNGGSGYSIKKLMECVKACDRQSFVLEYQKMVNCLQSSSVQAASESLIVLGIEMERYWRKTFFNQLELSVAQMEAVRQEIMDFHYIEEAMNWFLDLFGKITGELNRVNSSGSEDIVRNVTNYLEQNYMDVNLSAQYMAEKFNITPSYFSRIFKEHCGRTFPDYLSGLRLEKARKMLLDEPEKNIQTICEASGYISSSYFTSMFKKKYGMTPSRYKQNQQ